MQKKENKKDNPVPSLDKNKIEKAFKKNFWNGHFVEIHSGDYEEIIEIILNLQNGVETNNEKPKCEHPYNRTHRVDDIVFCNKCKTSIK